jgi:sec-independent protein translocase protein TatA
MELRLMPQLGVLELLIILVIIVLVFGVGKLPQIGKAHGQGIREFRESAQGLREEDTSLGTSEESGKA